MLIYLITIKRSKQIQVGEKMQKKIEQEKISYLFDNLPLSLAALFALITVIYFMFLPHIDSSKLNLWFGSGVAIILVRAVSYLYYKQKCNYTSFKNLFQNKKVFMLLTTLTVLQLGSGAFLIFPEDANYQIVLIFFIGGLATAASVTLATSQLIYKIYLLGSMLPYAAVLFLEGGESNYALVFSILLYIAFLWVNANKISSNVIHNIELTHSNAHLIKKLEEEVKVSKVANEAKSKFLAVMSHELRTPLNAIIGFSQILLRRGGLEEKTSSYIEKINISGNNLLLLVNSILDFSKIDKGEMEFNPENFHFQELLDEIHVLIEPQLAEKHIHYTAFDDPELVMFADKQLLKQAFVNILANAVKFTPTNGTIEISHSLNNSKHLFCVHDNGEGIDPKDIENLFEPFKQAQNSKNNIVQGTGLGLAITAKIIQEVHNGKIWVESDAKKGTSFFIEL